MKPSNAYYKIVNSALDEMPEFATVANKDKQSFNNMHDRFQLDCCSQAIWKANKTTTPKTIANYRKLAGMLINMVLKTNPENITPRKQSDRDEVVRIVRYLESK